MQINKKTIIFLLIFSIAFLGITIGAILYTKKNWTDQSSTVIIEEDSKQEVVEAENNLQIDTFIGETTKLTDTYKNNALKIKEILYTVGTPLDGSEYAERVRFTYPEISNLSDATIQTNINNLVKEKVFSFYKEGEENDSNIKHIEISAKATANFADVLSISIEYEKEFANGQKVTDFTGLNYRLENGEEIKFQNLFIVGAGIKNILRHNAYNSFAWDYKKEKITDMRTVDYHDLDTKVYEALNYYSNNSSPEFYFSEKEIKVKLNGKPVIIPFDECFDQIAIYNKYLSQDQLYMSTSMATDIPILVDRDEYSEMNIYMNNNTNLIIDINLNIENIKEDSSAVNTAIENYKKAINDSINILKQDSQENKDKYVYFISRITAQIDKEENRLIFKEETYKYIAYSETHFNVYITAPILTEKRTSLNSNDITKFDLNDNNITIQNLTNDIEYDLTTGNLYVEPEEEIVEETPEQVPETNEVINHTMPEENIIDENIVENEVIPDNVIEHENENEYEDEEENDEDDEEGTTVIV